MNVSLTGELNDFVRKKVADGQYASEQAVIEAALMKLCGEYESQETARTLDDFIDHEFVEYCTREADDSVTLEEVLHATSTIHDSMARVLIEEERAERF